MTNIEKIKLARQDLDCLLLELGERAEFRKRISKLQFEALKVLLQDYAYAQAEALRQATEVADENFARAQKLGEQVQENVRHIERLAAIKTNSESMSKWQTECIKQGFQYVRESDDHYVVASPEEMANLLREVLGIDVRNKDCDTYRLSAEREALRAFIGSAYPVSRDINERGYNWSEAYLDQALALAKGEAV